MAKETSRENFAGKRTTVNRVYPIEILQDMRNFPYIQFDIIEYRPFIKIEDKADQTATLGNTINPYEFSRNVDIINKAYDGLTPIDKNTLKPIETIILPIPQSIQDNFGVNWEMANNQIIQSVLEQAAKDTGMTWTGFGKAMLESGQGIFGNVARPFTGYSANPRKQAIFHAPEHRVFNFDFIFTPTTEKEAEQVVEILRSFKKFSAPGKSENGAMLKFPKEFVVSFKNVKGFPEIDSCVCLGVSSNYTTASLQLLKSGHSVQITMSLTLQEVTLRTEEHPGI